MESQEVCLRLLEIVAQVFVGIAIFRATIKAPSLAVENQKKREKEELSSSRKLSIFYTLMQTRNHRVSYQHTEALNMIDMEYNGVTDVTYAWSEYLHHLNTFSNTDQWNHERDKLFVELLHKMSDFLGYSYTKLDIKNKVYSPQGQWDQELSQWEINKYLADILTGRKSLPVSISQEDQKVTND
jgi:GTP1/Obg family GTP-binding protein